MPSKKSKGKAKGKSKASNPLPAKPQMTKPPGSVPPPILPPLVTPTSNISSRHGSVSGSPIPPSTPPSRAVQSPRPPFLPPLLSTLAMDGPGSQRSSPTINPPPHTSHSNLDLRLMDLEKFTARYSSMPPPQLDPHDPDAQEANELINCARAKLQADITMQTGYGKTVFPGQEQAVRKGLDELMDMSRKHMENGGVQDNEVDEEGYWASFPPNIRNFAQAMYAIAQQMVQSSEEASGDAATQDNAGMKTQFPRHDLDLSHLEALAMSMPGGLDAVAVGVEGRGRGNNIVTTKATTFSGTTTTTTTTALGASTMPAFSLDVLSDPAFKQSLKDAAAALAPLPIPKERGGTYYVGREGYDDEEEVEGDDVDDEEEEYDDEDESLAQPPRAAKSTMADPPAPLSPTHRTASEQPEAGENKIGKKKRNKGKGRAESSEDQGCPSPAMPAGRNNIQQQDKQQQQQQLAQAVAQQPSSVSIGKKPMAYPPQQQGGQQPQPGQPGQQPQRSARAASKAPVTYSPQQQQPTQQHHHPSPPSSNASKGRGGGQKAASSTNPTPHQNNKIWSTSTTEERERIKDFWLGLGEEERRNLVKIEKDTVLRKMKEQQKHSCSCAVCGRKRHAIEEELEVLYDAYYEELEQYANYQQRYVSSGGKLPPPPGPGPFPGSVELDKNGAVITHPPLTSKQQQHHPPNSRGKQPAVTANGRKGTVHTRQVVPLNSKHLTMGEPEYDDEEPEEEEYEEDEEEEEEYEEEEEEEEEDEEEEEGLEGDDDPPGNGKHPNHQLRNQIGARTNSRRQQGQRTPAGRGGRTQPNGAGKAASRDGYFNLSNSLTVTGLGNILTVADDLLKNDGQKFLEMMEQLAERRMQREEEAAADVEDDSEDEEEDEEEEAEEEEEDEEDEEDEDDDEEEEITEEQKMEEGKRMFSIFAARMFEQRVLQAYREKVAQERQLQLLRELEDEDKMSKEREAKKQTQNQKKKDKKRQQKQAKEEERAQRAAEKAAEEAAVKAKQIAQEEEQRKKREEDRARREAAKRAQDEERQRKEEDRRKRLQEEKEREAERERKRKEKEEKAKKEREDRERKTREEKEARLAAEKEKEKERAAAAAEKAKVEKEKEAQRKQAAKEKEAKEKEAKERAALQRATASSSNASGSPSSSKNGPRTPAASRTNSTSNAAASSSRSPGSGSTPKKVHNKNNGNGSAVPSVSPITTPTRPPLSQHSAVPQQQHPIPQPQLRPMLSQPPTPITSQGPNHIPGPPPQSNLLYQQGPPGMIPPHPISPRAPGFGVTPNPFGFSTPGPSHQPAAGPSALAPSPLPRNISGGPPFDPTFSRQSVLSAPLPTPIGPPPKLKSPLVQSASASSLVGSTPTFGATRRPSVPIIGSGAPDPGPVARPVIAPIARPMTASTTTNTSGSNDPSRSGNGSPNRRSPSPKILGSSALAAEDDEVVTAPSRRTTVPVGAVGSAIGVGSMGHPWGPTSPRGAIGDNLLRGPGGGNASPWGAPGGSMPPGPAGFVGSPVGRPMMANPGIHNPHQPPPPVGGATIWGNVSPSSDWHPAGSFFPPPFVSHNTSTSSPHAGGQMN